MKFQIRNDRLDVGEWGPVDKSAQWQILREGVAGQAEGAVAAVQEMYAVVKAEVTEALTLADTWGPHHTLRQDGTLVLNRGGMIAAAAALVGVGAEPDLTTAQRAIAARHLLRHYQQENVNLQPPQLLFDLAGVGEMACLTARIAGEMRPTDIPLASGVSVLALKAGDPDPLEVVMEIPSGTSQRGWVYGKVVIRHLAEQMAVKMYAGYLGHQKQEDVETEFPQPVTHWVGAMYRDGSAFVRGVVDKASSDLKRWVRAGAITQVSIYGYVATEVREGVTHVTSIELLSLDWVPLDRAGMKTRLIAIGEQGRNTKGADRVTLVELLAELRKLGAKPAQVIGEMGWDVKTLAKDLEWKLDKVAGEIEPVRWEQVTGAVKAVGEIADMFGLAKEAKLSDLVPAVKTAREAQFKAATAEHDKLVNKVIGEMVQAETIRPLVKRMLRVDAGADEASIKKALGEMLGQEDVKKALAEVFKGDSITPKADPRTVSSGSNTVKRTAI
ncbi:MAG: hypothetical protein DDT37_01821 [Firmicutes bacterium]|nr:hypothetical protein [candidate division NPL-UPA2 bacterium]